MPTRGSRQAVARGSRNPSRRVHHDHLRNLWPPDDRALRLRAGRATVLIFWVLALPARAWRSRIPEGHARVLGGLTKSHLLVVIRKIVIDRKERRETGHNRLMPDSARICPSGRARTPRGQGCLSARVGAFVLRLHAHAIRGLPARRRAPPRHSRIVQRRQP